MRASQVAILRKADAAAGRELRGFDLLDSGCDHRAEAVTLFLADSCAQILDLDQPLAHKDYECDREKEIGPEILLRISQLCDTSMEWILTGSERGPRK
jgi:hypothetical protein